MIDISIITMGSDLRMHTNVYDFCMICLNSVITFMCFKNSPVDSSQEVELVAKVAATEYKQCYNKCIAYSDLLLNICRLQTHFIMVYLCVNMAL